MFANDTIMARASELAKADGNHLSAEGPDYISRARRQLELETAEHKLQAGLAKREPPSDEDLLAKAATAALRRGLPTGAHAARRTVIGEVETREGRFHLEIDDQGASEAFLHIGDIHLPMADLDADVRNMIFATAAGFNAAEAGSEQVVQRGLVGLAVNAALERHQWLSAKVRERQIKQRYDV